MRGKDLYEQLPGEPGLLGMEKRQQAFELAIGWGTPSPTGR
jgi:hypothetical protein